MIGISSILCVSSERINISTEILILILSISVLLSISTNTAFSGVHTGHTSPFDWHSPFHSAMFYSVSIFSLSWALSYLFLFHVSAIINDIVKSNFPVFLSSTYKHSCFCTWSLCSATLLAPVVSARRGAGLCFVLVDDARYPVNRLLHSFLQSLVSSLCLTEPAWTCTALFSRSHEGAARASSSYGATSLPSPRKTLVESFS